MLGDIPERFVLAMPDDALAPHTVRGTRLLFVKGDQPTSFGVGVLVRDAQGQHHVRRYVQGPAGQWAAEARNTAYRSIGASDGALIVAWVEGRFDGAV